MSQFQQGDYFLSQANAYSPVASGVPFTPSTGLEGLPGAGSNPLVMMFGNQILSSLMGRAGYSPMGLGHDRNVMDTMQAQRFWRLQMQMQQEAAEMDRQGWISSMRGLAHLTGTPWGADQMRAAHGLSDAMITASPMLTMMMPDLMDEMAGYRGSGAVMAGKMLMAGRYRLDPLTGRLGQDPSQVGALATRMFDDMYVKGEMRETQGISAGKMGELYEQLQMRGMIGGPRMTPAQQVRELASTDPKFISDAAARRGVPLVAGKPMTADQVDTLMGDNQVTDRLQSIDSTRITNSLKGYLKAVAAVRDIFGDMGRPNAPMSELINALESLTAGSVGQINPGRLDTMVRMTQQLAKNTGVTIDAAIGMQQHAANRAAQLGLEPIFAVDALQGSLAFGGAYRALGIGSTPAWGKMNSDQVQQLDMNLRVNAAASRQANRLGLALRLGEQYQFDPKSEAGALVTGLRDAKDTGQEGYRLADGTDKRFSEVTEAEFMRIMGNANVIGKDGTSHRLSLNTHDLDVMLNQRFANSQYVESGGIVDVVRRGQREGDMLPWLQRSLQGFMQGQMGRHGIMGDEQIKAASTASREAARRIMDMDPSDFANDTTRSDMMTGIFRDELGKTAGGQSLIKKLQGEGRSPDEFFRGTADSFKGYWDQLIRYSPDLAYLGSSQNMVTAFNSRIQQQATRITQDERFNAEVRSALAPLNRGGIVRRAVGFLQRLGEDGGTGDDDLYRMAAESLGGVSKDEVKSRMGLVMKDVNARRQEIESLQKQLAAADDDGTTVEFKPAGSGLLGMVSLPQRVNKKRFLSDQLREKIGQLRTASNDALATMSPMGVGDEEMLRPEDLNTALNYTSHVDRNAGKVEAIRVGKIKDAKTGADRDMTADERNAALDQFFTTAPGKQYAHDVLRQGASADTVSMKMLNNEANLRQFGTVGIRNAEAIRDANDKLRVMAFEYSDNSIEYLTSGRLDPSLSKDKAEFIRGETQKAIIQRTAAVQAIFNAQEEYTRTGRQWGNLDDLTTELNSGIAPGKSVVTRKTVGLAHDITEVESYDVRGYQNLLTEAARYKEAKQDPSKTFQERMQKQRDKIEIIAKRLGVSVDEVMKAPEVYERIHERAIRSQRNKAGGFTEASQVLDAFGLPAEVKSEQGRADTKGLADIMNTEGGDMIRRLGKEHTDVIATARKLDPKLKGENGQKVFMQMYEQFEDLKYDKFSALYDAKLGKGKGRILADKLQLQAASGNYSYEDEIGADGKPTGRKKGYSLATTSREFAENVSRRLHSGDMDHGGKPMKVEFPDGATFRLVGDVNVHDDGKGSINGKVSASKTNAPSPSN